MVQPNIRTLAVPLLIAALACASCITPATNPATAPAADLSTPAAAYRTYLLAIKRNDLQAASACVAATDKNEAAFADVLNGGFINCHRLYTLAAGKFAAKDIEDFKELAFSASSSDAGIDLALGRLDHAMAIISGDTATLTLAPDLSNKNDGPDAAVFKISDDPVSMRKVAGVWKVDLVKLTDTPQSDQLLAPGTYGSGMRQAVKLLDDLCTDLASGSITTIEQFKHDVAAKTSALQKQLETEMRNARTPPAKP
jgi:hypothetical protein